MPGHVEGQAAPRRWTTNLSEVWMMQHGDSPDNTVLGTRDEARAFMDEVEDGSERA